METRNRRWPTLLLMAAVLPAGCSKNGGSPVQPFVAAEEPAQPAGKSNDRPKKDAVAPLESGGTFRFPDNDGGKILASVLPPVPPPPLAPLPPKGPTERLLPPAVAQPDLTTLPNWASPSRLPPPPRAAPRPAPLPDRVPVDLAPAELAKPERLVLPAGPLTKLDAPDVSRPAPLPILARPTPDRASLDDPTAEFTAQSLINDKLSLRSTAAPFVKVNVPDPFENSEAKVKVPAKVDPQKLLGDLPSPKP